MFEALAKSRFGMKMALGVGRLVPPALASGAVDFATDRIARGDAEVWRAARANQYVVSGCTLTGAALDAAARENVRSQARTLYDLYHSLGRPSAEQAIFEHTDGFDELLECDASAGPFVYVGVHLGNFDLIGRLLSLAGWRVQVLSVPDPNGGYEWQNEVREQAGFEMTPVSLESLKQAGRRLEGGKSILTGLDFPMPEPDKVRPRFFGHEASLPLLHVRLAMRARVPVIVITAPRMADGRYRLFASDPIPMEEGRGDQVLQGNAERCLAVAERWIAERPEQWAMPHLVWPDIGAPET